jgi:protoporphyrinogen IX oxidase
VFEVTSLYPWIKAFHIIAVVSWMAAMFAMTLLLIGAKADHYMAKSDGFVRMAGFIRAWMNPAMAATVILGTVLVLLEPVWDSQGWLQAKLPLVFGMFALHGLLSRQVRNPSRMQVSTKYQPVLLMAPFLLFALIVVLAVVKPF